MTSNNTTPPKKNPLKLLVDPKHKHHYPQVPTNQYYTPEGADPKKPGSKLELKLPMVYLLGDQEAEVEANCYADTLELFKGKIPKKDEPSNWDQVLNVQRAYWTIYYAMRVPGDLESNWFDSKAEVEATYNWDEIDVLMAHYLDLKMDQPIYKHLNVDDPNAFQKVLDHIKSLGTDPEGNFFLNGFTTHAVNQLIRFLVKERENYQTNNGSSGSP